MIEESSRADSKRGTCSTCQTNVALYTCPRCHIDSCSVPCIKKHKQDSGCNGERDKTAFITIKDYTENNLLSDYRFLEEVNRSKQAAHRSMHSHMHDTSSESRRGELRAIALRKRIQFVQLPATFSRSKRNRTTTRNRTIHWTVEVKFVQSGVKFIEDSVYENEKFETLLNRFLKDPIKKQRIKPYVAAGLGKIKVLMKSKPIQQEPEKKGFHVLDTSKTLQENLSRNYVVEFPELIVILEDKLSDYKVFEKEVASFVNLEEMERNPNAWPRRRRQRKRKNSTEQPGTEGEASSEKKPKTEEVVQVEGAKTANASEDEVAKASRDKDEKGKDGKGEETAKAPESAETKESDKQDQEVEEPAKVEPSNGKGGKEEEVAGDKTPSAATGPESKGGQDAAEESGGSDQSESDDE